MSTYEAVFSAACQLPIADRLRLIDELAASVPDDEPPALGPEWLAEIERRSAELDSGAVTTESWEVIRARLHAKLGLPGAN